ncbi:MAG TPA: hypothetical protein VJB60_03780 [Candidatus Peribacterales bacterium]|nr:hypothetical protein [Candidatus Peribacterales bacterium]
MEKTSQEQELPAGLAGEIAEDHSMSEENKQDERERQKEISLRLERASAGGKFVKTMRRIH